MRRPLWAAALVVFAVLCLVVSTTWTSSTVPNLSVPAGQFPNGTNIFTPIPPPTPPLPLVGAVNSTYANSTIRLETNATSIADMAVKWLEAHAREIFPSSPALMVVDYAMRHPYWLPTKLPANWTFLTAPLVTASPQDAVDPWPANQVLWAEATAHRLQSLFPTMNYFDIQLLLRLGELAPAIQAGGLSLQNLIGNVLGMSRFTYLVLPCSLDVQDEKEEVAFVLSAVRGVVARRYTVGLKGLHVDVSSVRRFRSGGCERSLLKSETVRMLRGVRHYWCYHSWRFKHKFDLKIQDRSQFILLKLVVASKKGKMLGGKFVPNINFAELLGWGLNEEFRLLLFYDCLRMGNFPDPYQQNWLLTNGGRALRIDRGHGRRVHMTGNEYFEHLRGILCLPHVPIKNFECGLTPSCRTCMHFRFPPGQDPPAACHECYLCVQKEFMHRRAFLSNGKIAENCDGLDPNATRGISLQNMSTEWVQPNEHHCYSYSELGSQ